MDSIDDIWDNPIDTTGNDDEPQASSSKQPLFLADSVDDEVPRPPPSKAPDFDVDIDAMFADVENDDEAFNIQPLTSKLDSEALRREAEARHKRNMPTLTPHAILSSSPPREIGDGEARSTSKAPGGEKTKDGKKERRKPVRLDEGRLLGPTGFPKLIKDTKDFKIKGKGYEVTDMNRLLQVYGYWTHEMYPKTTFRDTVERVEKLCHSKRMNVALSVWRDEAKGLINGRKPEEDDDLTENMEETEIRDPETGSSRGSSPVSGGAAYASSSSCPPSRPPSSGAELDDDFDIDAVIRAEEERQAREAAGSSPSVAPTNAAEKGKAKAVVSDDEDESMWDVIDAMGTFPPTQAPSTTTTRMDDDDAMWDELHTLEASTVTVSAPTKPPPVQQPMNEDEDMWDVVREVENDAGAQKPQPTPMPAAAAAPPPLPVSTTQEDEDEWESMYA
ncbi:hypothetical protein DXG03_006660 [Asterophora parasitica]|uniref:Chromosome segregation in meiosis protein n=1 Tax=Asterophora parasitica TaxID=117018 RepID=A0A9P7GAN0_9AGAR|nr:hypothetical protein DXG03_006660 [Asterophora parasitica]